MSDEYRFRAPERMAPPPEIVSLDDINIRLRRLNENISRLIDVMNRSLTRLNNIELAIKETAKAVQETVPEGIIIPTTVTVTGEKILNFKAEPLYSFSLFNDGPGDVYVGVNTYPEQTVPIREKESYDCAINKKGAIKQIVLVCPTSATVRIYAVR